MNSQKIRRLCVAMITLPVVAIGAATIGRAQKKSFDGAYKGTLECEQGLEVYRMPLAIIIRDGLVVGGALLLDPDGRRVAPETGSGTVNPDGVFRLRYIAYFPQYSIEGDYTGTLTATGGTLTGTQVMTREISGDGGIRTCKGTFPKVDLPRQ